MKTDDELSDERLLIVPIMKQYGGSFAKGLAEAMWNADTVNLRKIYDTWPEIWAKNLDVHENLQKQRAARKRK